MALTRKNLTLDAERLQELAERRGESESAAAREAIAQALFADELVDLLRQLHESGFDLAEPRRVAFEYSPDDESPDAPPAAV